MGVRIDNHRQWETQFLWGNTNRWKAVVGKDTEEGMPHFLIVGTPGDSTLEVISG